MIIACLLAGMSKMLAVCNVAYGNKKMARIERCMRQIVLRGELKYKVNVLPQDEAGVQQAMGRAYLVLTHQQ